MERKGNKYTAVKKRVVTLSKDACSIFITPIVEVKRSCLSQTFVAMKSI